MRLARSKLTTQGQISVPAEVRRNLGLGPGAILEWKPEGDHYVVRRAGQRSSEDVHEALFPAGAPRTRSLAEMKEAIRRRIRERHARR